MRFIHSLLITATILLNGCDSAHMKQFVGKDIRDVMMVSGKPSNVFDMSDGRRAFQFYWGGGEFPIPGTTIGTGSVVGNTALINSSTIGGGTINTKGCLITYIAQRNEVSAPWIVVETRYPSGLFC